jgi:hypothetical protein
MKGTAAAAVLGACLVFCLAFAGCDACGNVHQSVFIPSPDPSLQALVDGCRAGVPPAGTVCSPPHADASPIIVDRKPVASCACLPLCLRVLELIDQFAGRETLMDCQVVYLQGDGGAGAVVDAGAPDAGADGATGGPVQGTVRVDVTYELSRCE